MDAALDLTGIWPTREYVRSRQATIADYFKRKANIKPMHRNGEDGGIHKVPQVVGSRTQSHIGGEGGRVKEK